MCIVESFDFILYEVGSARIQTYIHQGCIFFKCLENLPQHLRNEGKGRKKKENGKKNMRRGGKRIFSNGLGEIFIKNLLQLLKKLSEREEKDEDLP